MIPVTGATGNVGREVVGALAAAGEPMRALSRRPDAPVPAGVAVAVGDIDRPDSLPAALSGVDGVFLLAGFVASSDPADIGAVAALALTRSVTPARPTGSPVPSRRLPAGRGRWRSSADPAPGQLLGS